MDWIRNRHLVLIHLNYYGRRSIVASEMSRAGTLQILYEDVKGAQKRLQDASEYLDLAIRNRHQQRVRLAARSHRIAAHGLTTAVSRLDRFMLEGIVPETLKAHPGRKREPVSPLRSRKSA
jgi:hypothetical protein